MQELSLLSQVSLYVLLGIRRKDETERFLG